MCCSYPCWYEAKPQQFKCERKDTQCGTVVSLAVKESEAPVGEAHLFTPEYMTLCVYVGERERECVCVCVDQAPTGAKTQK